MHLYDQALKHMERTVHQLASRVPRPQKVPFKDSFVFRYVEKTVHQALVQKLARLVSGLHAARLLMEAGFVQEQAALQRILDEITDDISFLSFSVIFGDAQDVTLFHAGEHMIGKLATGNIAHMQLDKLVVRRHGSRGSAPTSTIALLI